MAGLLRICLGGFYYGFYANGGRLLSIQVASAELLGCGRCSLCRTSMGYSGGTTWHIPVQELTNGWIDVKHLHKMGGICS